MCRGAQGHVWGTPGMMACPAAAALCSPLFQPCVNKAVTCSMGDVRCLGSAGECHGPPPPAGPWWPQPANS